MTFSVGILYSAHEFLEFAKQKPFKVAEFANHRKFALADPAAILRLAQDCNWIQVGIDDYIVLTERGLEIVTLSAPTLKLRLQIRHLINCYRPAWATKLMHGREEAVTAMPSDVKQCFREGGLLDGWNDDLIDWWSAASAEARFFRSEKLSRTGRKAEEWSCGYESGRVGRSPKRVSLDSSFAGYDVLSKASVADDTPLLIEVKGSERRPSEADFSLSRHEYRTARKSANYILHLWFVAQVRQLFVVPFNEVLKHLPIDQNQGMWDSSRIPYAAFLSFRVI